MRRGSLLICALMLVMLSYTSISSTGIPFEDKFVDDLTDMIPEGQNVSLPNPFENLTDIKNKLWERFSHIFNKNESEIEKEWLSLIHI